jgi:sec-independent protein translocase protein TatB
VFNVGTPELLVILLVALIVLGPAKLPDAARQVGRFVGELRKVSTGFQSELRDAMQEPVSGNGVRRRSDPVPKAPPANGFKPVSQVIPDEQAVPESVAADPSSASPGATASPEPVDDQVGTGDDPAAGSSAQPDDPPANAR